MKENNELQPIKNHFTKFNPDDIVAWSKFRLMPSKETMQRTLDRLIIKLVEQHDPNKFGFMIGRQLDIEGDKYGTLVLHSKLVPHYKRPYLFVCDDKNVHEEYIIWYAKHKKEPCYRIVKGYTMKLELHVVLDLPDYPYDINTYIRPRFN